MDSARPERFELPTSGFVAPCIYRLFQINKLDAPPSPNFTLRPAESRRALIPHALVLRDVHRWAELDLAALVAAGNTKIPVPYRTRALLCSTQFPRSFLPRRCRPRPKSCS